MAEIHNRMPVILPPEIRGIWLSRETPAEQLAGLLAAHAPDSMKAYAVSTRVNTPRNQESALIEPAGTD